MKLIKIAATVTVVDDMLPPVVDIEPYGKYKDVEQIDQEKMITELNAYQ